ncbi:MAG: cupin-like domain-containing protein [Chitinophagales bacterium]
MQLQDVERRSGLTPEQFREEYLKPGKPVVFTDLAKDWNAVNRWSLDFFKNTYGDLNVPVFSSNYSKPGKGYMSSDKQMKFREFLEATEKGNTDLRLFLFDIFKSAPELLHDFQFPAIMRGFEKRLPFMFFGGEGSEVTMHYDIDCANVFLTQFVGHKRVILFAPEESRKIYHHPFTVKTLINPIDPDLKKFPALENVKGYDTILKHGETIFMPTRYWHYMRYLDFSFGLALRSYNDAGTRARGMFNIAAHFLIDKGFNLAAPSAWHNWKERKAYENALPFEPKKAAA